MIRMPVHRPCRGLDVTFLLRIIETGKARLACLAEESNLQEPLSTSKRGDARLPLSPTRAWPDLDCQSSRVGILIEVFRGASTVTHDWCLVPESRPGCNVTQGQV